MYSGQLAHKALIFDVNNEYGEFGIKTIALEHVPVFMRHPKAEIRRIPPFKLTKKGWVKMGNSEILEHLEKLLGIYQDGGLLVEDINKTTHGSQVPPDLVGAICTNRHNSVDLIMHYQSISRPLPVIHENTNIYRFHWQGDDVYRSESKLHEHVQIFKLGQILVNREYMKSRDPDDPCKRFFVYINKDTGRIIGKFTYDQFNAALEEYISTNESELKPWLNKRDRMGKKVYTYPDAVDALQKQLFDRYWGNNDPSKNTREARMMIASGFKGVGKSYETLRYLREDYCVNIY